jgi:molecular chaperone GrpE
MNEDAAADEAGPDEEGRAGSGPESGPDPDDGNRDDEPAEGAGDGTDGAEGGGSADPADGTADPTTDGDGDAGANAARGGDADGAADGSLADRVARHDDTLADEVAALESRAEALESELSTAREEVAELQSRLKRKQADFQNYKKRAERERERIRERATADLIERLASVRDNLVRALEQDADAEIRPGVESTLAEFDRVLDDEGVEPIEPSPGDAVDPNRHEVMLRVGSDRPADTIAEVYQPGYETGDSVIRPAQVTVSDGSGDDTGDGSGDGSDSAVDGSDADA